MNELNSVISDLRRRGVVLVADGDLLRYRAPRDVLTPAERQMLAEQKYSILALLREASSREPATACVKSTSQLDRRAGHHLSKCGRCDGADPHRDSHQARLATINSTIKAKEGRCASSDTELYSLPEHGFGSHNSQNSPSLPVTANIANSAKPNSKSPRHSVADSELVPRGKRSVTIGKKRFTYHFWEGAELGGDLIGFDTETEAIQDHEIPELALASASTGTECCLIHPSLLAEFILRHRDRSFVLFNAAFDYWVVHDFLSKRGETETLDAWTELVDEDRMHDAMLLDMLIKLGKTDAYPRPRNLGEVALEYAGLQINKNDPYRLRYGEIIGADWTTLDRGFFDYAIGDAIATLAAYQAMSLEALKIMEAHGHDSTASS